MSRQTLLDQMGGAAAEGGDAIGYLAFEVVELADCVAEAGVRGWEVGVCWR